jgi:hypothetical protein
MQPLATCMHNLQLEKMAIGLQISEPWLREYQVLCLSFHVHYVVEVPPLSIIQYSWLTVSDVMD